MTPDELANILDQLLVELDEGMMMRNEARNRPQVNPSYEFPQDRVQAVQRVRNAVKNLDAKDVAIVYDNAQSVEMMDKEFLCRSSRYFEVALNGAFKEATTRIIRLRYDFPWAVYAMLDFLQNGCYYMYPLLCKQYPHITMLDLHVHGYIIADKYEVRALADYAAKNYLRIAADTLVLDWKFDDPDSYDDSLSMPCVYYLPWDFCAAAEVSRFLDSVVLLWRNTASRQDALRTEVLEMIKACFIKLMRLKSFQFLLANLPDFLHDLYESFGEDGVHIKMLARKHKGFRVTFAA
ncbi:hypothetical protein P171DRAFT_477035 [Karstenula rhodostoma CBS 690.94]|uniref:BTB domain-containing protein n=1 Tax=Karstenula rhodostoma CBS 690.94 TaxID=1392251 RepID=A0A9P4PA57_9PLEO|nr:hypothetical protein P171DRAFT_477035 [Karstenula rhodostoma CBS 690.94]